MAATSSSTRGGDEDVPLEELIFSCSICSATVSDVYKTGESNKGFHSGSGDDDGLVTKMWIADCSHVTCSKHLEGGAAPFHPKNTHPTASCPRCILSTDDHSPKSLFAIRGLGEGEYDPAIPSEWRKCPAIKLDSSIPGMEAVRFQYMALVHYGRRIRHSAQELQRKLHAMEKALSKERKQRRQLHTEVQDFQVRVERLDQVETSLKQWEARKPKIFHYLGVFGEMMKEIHGNRAVLRDLGYQVAERSYAFPGDEVALGEKSSEQQQTGKSKMNSATTVVAQEAESSSSARKRKREPEVRDDHELTGRARGSSRVLMPPPLPRVRRAQDLHRHQQAESGQQMAPSALQHAQNERRYHNEDLPYRPPPLSAQLSRSAQPPLRQRTEDVRDYPYQSRDLYAQQFHPIHESTEKQNHSHQHVPTTSAYTQATGYVQEPGSFPESSGPRTSGYGGSHGESQVPGFDARHDRLPFRDPGAYELTQNKPPNAYARPEREVDRSKSLAVRSPFFKTGAAYAEPGTVRPPIRGSPIENRGAASRKAMPSSVPRAPVEDSFSARLRQSLRERTYDEPFQQFAQHSQYPFVSPQTPWKSQPFLQRPDRLAPSAIPYPAARPQTQMARSRVSLPPNIDRAMPSYGEHDVALSRIQGVRGLTSRHGPPEAYVPPPAFGAPRLLFSAVATRRSVRR